nr:uncharacterized mitochondrial protein AtMg00810-like [Tanacetum cinerariifolium]
MTAFPKISRRARDNYYNLEDDMMVRKILNSGKHKDGVGMKILSWMITDEMKLTRNYRMHAVVFGYIVIRLRFPQRRSTRLTPPTPIPTTTKADVIILQDIIQLSLAEQKSRNKLKAKQNVQKVEEHLIADEIEKLVEGSENAENDEVDSTTLRKNDNPNDLCTRLELRSNKESLKVEITTEVQPVNINEEEEESSHDDYQLKSREKRKHVEDSRSTPSPITIRSPRIHSTLISLDTEKLPELTDDPHDDAHPKGKNDAKRQKTSEHATYVFGESSSSQDNESEPGPSTQNYWELGHKHKFITEIIARRANGSIVSITESDYKNLNKNDIEDMYLLIVNSKEDFKKLLIEEYCLDDEIQKLEYQLWNHKMLRSDVDRNKRQKTRMNFALTALDQGQVQRQYAGQHPKYAKCNSHHSGNCHVYGRCTFSLNDHFATILFDSGVDYSRISTNFLPLIDMKPRMDWLSKLRAKIVYFKKIVQILLSNEDILEFYGECPKGNLKQLKTMKVDKQKLKDILVVCNFPGVFLEDLLGLPLSREVGFYIDLIPRAMPVAKLPYHLAPMEMKRSKWLFEIDSLTKSMNYELVTAGNQTYDDAGIEINVTAGKARLEKASDHEYILLPFMPFHSPLSSSIQSSNDKDADEAPGKRDEGVSKGSGINNQESLNINIVGSNDPSMPSLDETSMFDDVYDDREVDTEADTNNLEVSIVMDVKSAFLYGTIEEELYVLQPPGFKDPYFPNKVKQKDDGIFISQDKYMDDILKKYDITTIKTASTLMEPNKALIKDAEAKDVDMHLYRSMIRSLMCLIASRPDIMFDVYACTRFQVTPKTSHLHDVKRISKYLKDGKKVIVNEASIRRDLKLDDAEGTTCLPNAAIIEELERMGYVQVFMNHQLGDMSHHKGIFANPSLTKKILKTHPFLLNNHPLNPKGSTNQKRKQRKETEVSQDVPPTEEHIPTPSYDPLPSGEDRLQVNELMEICTKLSNEILSLKQIKTNQIAKNEKLKTRVKNLKGKKKKRNHGLKRLYKGRSIADIDQDEGITLIDDTQGRINEEELFGFNNLDGDEVVLDVSAREKEEQSEKVVEKEDSTADPVTTAGEVVTTTDVEVSAALTTITTTDDELTLALTLIEIKAAKLKAPPTDVTIVTAVSTRPKEKGIIMQEPSETPSLKPIIFSQQPSQPKDKGKAKMSKNFKEVQQAFNKTMDWINNFVAMDSKAVNDRAIESSKRARDELEQESAMKQRLEKEDDSEELKRCLEIIPEDDDDVTIKATPLSSKSPTLVDYNIYK